MTMNTQQTGGTNPSNIPLGAKLQSAREAQRLDRKEAAAKLRLNENVIDMIENNSFPDNMPSIFVRGYIRAYGKLLQLPDDEIAAGLEPIKPSTVKQEVVTPPAPHDKPAINFKKLAIKTISVLITLTLVGLVAAWWHAHTKQTTQQMIALPVPQETTEAALAPAAPAPLASAPAVATEAASALAAPTMPAAPTATQPASVLASAPIASATATVGAPKTHADSASVPAYKRASAMTRPPVNLDDDTDSNR